MKILSLLLVSFFLLSIAHQKLASEISQTLIRPPIPSGCTTSSLYHDIYALDESGSMQQTDKWANLKSLMNNIAASDIAANNVEVDRKSVYTFDTVATVPPAQYYLFDDPAGWDSAVLPGTPSGGTKFGPPLLRATEIIDTYRFSHTCFVMITDGQAAYPATEIATFNAKKEWMNDRNCKMCAKCYFIKKDSTSVIPDAYQRLCESIGA